MRNITFSFLDAAFNLADTSTEKLSNKHLFFLLAQTRRFVLSFVGRKRIKQGIARQAEQLDRCGGMVSADALVSSDELERARRQSARGKNLLKEHNAMVSDNATTSVDGLAQNKRSETVAVAKTFSSDELERSQQPSSKTSVCRQVETAEKAPNTLNRAVGGRIEVEVKMSHTCNVGKSLNESIFGRTLFFSKIYFFGKLNS